MITVYHFLLPDAGMANYRDRAAKQLEAANFGHIKDWRRKFFQPFTAEEVQELEARSASVDEHWAEHVRQLAEDRAATEDALPVWGQPQLAHHGQRVEGQDPQPRRIQRRYPHGQSPYRLSLVMDYWCALWFWPIA